MKKYYSHGIHNFTKWKLLTIPQINSLTKAFSTENNFYSIHNYFEDGTKSCPVIYCDLDGGNAKDDMEVVKGIIQKWFNVIPAIWDSGNKGYHIILPYDIKHNKCEKITKYICNLLFGEIKTLDQSVYSSKRLWRIPNTFNPKGNRNKTLIYNYSGVLNINYLNELINQATQYVEDIKKPEYTECEKFIISDLPPCLYNLLIQLPPLGQRHTVRVLLARWFSANDIPLEDALGYVLSFPDYKERESKVIQVFESIYNNNVESYFGCHGENILQSNCMPFCQFLGGIGNGATNSLLSRRYGGSK